MLVGYWMKDAEMMFTDRSIIRSGYSMKKAQKAELPARASLDCIPNAYGTLQ